MARENIPVYASPRLVITFKLDRKGMARVAVGDDLRKAVIELAETKAKPYAVGISPRSDADHQHYQDSFIVEPGTTIQAGMMRVAARLVNTAQHAAAVEWGNHRNPQGHHVLGRTLDHLNTLGPRLDDVTGEHL